MSFGNPGALSIGFGKLGVQPAAGTSAAVNPSLVVFNFSNATSSMYVPLLGGFA